MWKFLILFCSLLLIAAAVSFDIHRVDGFSMEPRFEDGSIVIVQKNIFNRKITKPDDIVTFVNPLTGKLNIKRCTAVNDKKVFVTGINLPESTDSRHFGSIAADDIRGWVWIKI